MLNPKLFKGLSVFGEVKVVNEDEPMVYRLYREPGGITKVEIIESGEHYKICCPVCGDRRFRCYINHRFGTVESDTGRPFRDMVRLFHCFNEESCNRELGDKLERIKPYIGKGVVYRHVEPTECHKGPPPNPGKCTRMDKLDSEHPAIRYVKDRGFDPKELGCVYGMSYCWASNVPFTQGRIIIPIVQDGKIEGWQARFIRDIPDKDDLPRSRKSGIVQQVIHTGRSFQIQVDDVVYNFPDGSYPCVRKGENVTPGTRLALPVPKYYTAPGTPKRRLLYGFDRAKKYNFVVVTEGPMDVVRLGPPAVAVFGKTLSTLQTKLLINQWLRKAIVLMLDAGTMNDMLAMRKRLAETNSVLIIQLTDGKDPGDCKREELWKLIFSQAVKHNIDLCTK